MPAFAPHRFAKTKKGLLGLVGAWLLVGVLLWGIQSHVIYWGAERTVPWGNFHLKRPDVLLHGWVVHPQSSTALVVFGGNQMAVGPLAQQWQQCTTSALYLVPYRGYEGQAGTPGEDQMVNDGVALIEAVRKQHPHVEVLGVSLGTGVAAQVAARVAVDRVLLVAPYDRLTNVVQDHIRLWPANWIVSDPFDSMEALKHVRSPVAIVRAALDEIVLPERTDALLAALPHPPADVLTLPTTHEDLRGRPELCAWVHQQTQPNETYAALAIRPHGLASP